MSIGPRDGGRPAAWRSVDVPIELVPSSCQRVCGLGVPGAGCGRAVLQDICRRLLDTLTLHVPDPDFEVK